MNSQHWQLVTLLVLSGIGLAAVLIKLPTLVSRWTRGISSEVRVLSVDSASERFEEAPRCGGSWAA